MESLRSILRTLGGLAIVIVFCLAVLLSGCAEAEKPDEDSEYKYIQVFDCYPSINDSHTLL